MKHLALAAVLALGLVAPALADRDTSIAVLDSDAGGSVAAVQFAQSSLAVIDAPRRLKTDQETVDFSGRAIAPGEVTLTVNGVPVKVAPDGSFRIRQEVPVGRTDLLLVLEGSYGDRAEHNETDNLLIYYAGHGSLDIGSDEGYWLPVDAEPDNPVNWVSNNDVSGQLRAMTAKHVMVVADSCYSGKLTRSVATSLKTGTERTAWLKRMNGRRSRTALTSGGLEPVVDAGGGRHSVFAKAFITALAENEGVMEGQRLFDTIKRPVVLNANQTPQYSDIRLSGHEGGDFMFVKRRR